ncbi:lysine--tRNA ligase [Blochmannia endosymbiont of Camponotus sp.]|uniref:lysine--tRNA ligase n=1 Tax=Blochmannia endosymbiont of Camponotus sp. TaxID=700220 RepID=UPI002024BD0A|nr:lysine--tRNA ligase [Blochmannia endosymbiont of Camponotus sp.]URJ30991.1 lysine--tRNA ligase [Blochmannia endosymbiont of Camponotus sp.]
MPKYLYSKNQLYQKLNINDELSIRQKKLSQIREKGVAFPNDFRRDSTSNQLHKKYEHTSNAELIQLNIEVNIAGRIISQRIMGKASFITLQDVDGCIQLYITANSLAMNVYEENIKQWDLGDILGARGTLFRTRTGELSIHCKEIRLLTKSLRPLPDKFHGLNNQETKYRQRYLDLIINEDTREIFKIRSLIIYEIRQFMKKNNFMEVETPMMHTIAGGAIANPFITHHNKLGIDVYLRIAPELYLKKLVIGGFERIFEINRNFRNEGISSYHNPEFTMMEVYMAYADYRDMIVLVQNLLRSVTQRVLGSNIVHYGNYELDFNNPFSKMTVKEAIYYYLPETRSQNVDNIYTAISIAKLFGITINNYWTLSKIHMVIFEEIVEKKIIQPTCVTSYPIEISPLARRNDNNPQLADRFELFIAGKEIGNGFSELNDPEDQKERFLKQAKEKKDIKNNNIHINYDEDYLIALEHGLPPTAGIGIGIDRLVMLLTNKHTIRDVILFPTLRPK